MTEEIQDNFLTKTNRIQELIKVVEKVKRESIKHQKKLEKILPKISDPTIKDEIQLMNSLQSDVDKIVKVSKNALYNNYKRKFPEIIELLSSFQHKEKTFKYFIPSKSMTARTLTGELVPININPTPCTHYHEIYYKPDLYKHKLSGDVSIFELYDGGFIILKYNTLHIFSKSVCTSIYLDLSDFVYGNGFIVTVDCSELICYKDGVVAHGDFLYVTYRLRPHTDHRLFIFCWSYETKSVVWNTQICNSDYDMPHIHKYEDFLHVSMYKEGSQTRNYFINYKGELIPETERPLFEINSFGYSSGVIYKEHSFKDIQADFALDGVAVLRLPNGADNATILADGTVAFTKKETLFFQRYLTLVLKGTRV
jgi:hypothetical protein